MYAYLDGKISELTPTYVVIDCGGVGYFVHISLHTYSQLKNLAHAKILTHSIVREDAHLLYGFLEPDERKLFLYLISVSGVGPNTARMMLSTLNPTELTQALLQGDVAKIQAIKGIGAKTAQRLIVDLKDRLSKEEWSGTIDSSAIASSSASQEALSALVMLGFNKSAAEKALQSILKIQPEFSAENLIKEALRML